jgi:predicted molibdopterin-dependent oxidoreductase YjgC
MIKLKIDKKQIEAEAGTKIIEAARTAGIDIPSLCYKSDLPHYTSCMVCMVKDETSGKFIPSCSAFVEEDLIIDTSGEEVKELRKEALSLLLTEHRAECEAPCKNVCPAGYDIPLINRTLKKDDLDSVYNIIRESIEHNGFACENCSAPCEKACRRKMIDTTISIRNLIVYVHKESMSKNNTKTFHGVNQLKKFNSTIGKLDDSEKPEWLKECSDSGSRFIKPENIDQLRSEASNCMHCDCRAINECQLRDLCDDMGVKNPRRIRTGPPIQKKINNKNGLIFENAKCIKCGLCVRAVSDSTNDPSLCFTGRGFMSLISEPKTYEFDSILIDKADIVVNVCPTGALSKME